MNLNRMIDMFVRLVMRKVMSKGIDKGFSAMSKRGGGKDDPQQDKKNRENAKRARQAAKISRRIGR